MKKALKKNENNVKQIHSQDVLNVVEKKIQFFQDVIQKTMLYVQKNKMLDILGVSEVTNCFQGLNEISDKIRDLLLTKNTITTEVLINNLQSINNDLSGIFKMYGTESLEDLLTICFGSNVHLVTATDDLMHDKFSLLKKYFHPTGYKVISPTKHNDILVEKTEKTIKTTKIGNANENEEYSENINHLDCFDISSQMKKFHMKVYGIKFYLTNTLMKRTILLYGTVDDVIVDFMMNNKYLYMKIQKINENNPSEQEFHTDTFRNFVLSLSLKELLINSHHDVYKMFMGYMNQLCLIKQKPINQCVKEFIGSDLFAKRSTIIQLLIKTSDYENQY